MRHVRQQLIIDGEVFRVDNIFLQREPVRRSRCVGLNAESLQSRISSVKLVEGYSERVTCYCVHHVLVESHIYS